MSAGLRALEGVLRRFDPEAAERKLDLLRRLDRERLGSARTVRRLHEALCFLRAYPDGPAVLAQVEAMLDRFGSRSDLRRHAAALEDSGIAGTATVYPFFMEMAGWLVDRWPDRVTVAWEQMDDTEWFENALDLMALPAEVPGLDEYAWPLRTWVRRLKGPDETDAAFLVRRMQRLPAGPALRQVLYEDRDLFLRLAPGPGTPARTRARVPRRRIHWQRAPLDAGRPDLLEELRRPPVAVRAVSRREGQRLVDLAREAMVTRSRDLDAFAYGDPADVRLVDCGGGLEFAAIGLRPERRLLLEAVYGFLTLKNGVPIGYVLNSALFGSAEIAYNVFETYRGAEAAAVYGRVLAMVRHLFGVDSFTIYPYQLGDDNEEGLASGAWWFYQKLGFRARDPGVLALMRRELARMRRNPAHRSSLATLRRLARENVYLHAGRMRDDVIGVLPLARVGLAVTDLVARRFGADRERAGRELSAEAAGRLGVRGLRGWSRGEREAWRRWAPLVMALPGVDRWPAPERRAVAAVVRAKGGRRESDFVLAFDRHRRLRRAVAALAARGD